MADDDDLPSLEQVLAAEDNNFLAGYEAFQALLEAVFPAIKKVYTDPGSCARGRAYLAMTPRERTLASSSYLNYSLGGLTEQEHTVLDDYLVQKLDLLTAPEGQVRFFRFVVILEAVVLVVAKKAQISYEEAMGRVFPPVPQFPE